MVAKTDWVDMAVGGTVIPHVNTVYASDLNTLGTEVNTKYVKPATGIPTTDLADGAVTAIKISNGQVGIAKLSATGTPGNTTYLRGDNTWGVPPGGGGGGTGDVTSAVSLSANNQVALYSGALGKTITPAVITGLAKLVAGVLSAAVAGTDYVAPGGALGTPTSGNLVNCTNVSAAAVATVLADTPRFIVYNAGWAARPNDDRRVFYLGGATATNAPVDANLRTFDVWIPAT